MRCRIRSRPVEPAPAGRTPAAGFLRKKMLQVPHHADRTGLIVQHDHGAGAHPAAGFLHFAEVHGHVQMLFDKKIGRSAARKQRHETSHRRAFHPRVLQEFRASSCPSAVPIGLVASLFRLRRRAWCRRPCCAAQARNHAAPMVDDVGHVAQRLDVVDDRGFAPETRRPGEMAAWNADLHACLPGRSATRSPHRTCSGPR